MAASFKINHAFDGAKTPATIDLTNLDTHHRYGSYSKSTLTVYHDSTNKESGSLPVHIDNNETHLQHNNDDCCSSYCGFVSIISYHLPILHPFGPFRCFWDLLVMIMLIYTCVEVPVTLAFNVELFLNSFSGIISFSIDILLLIDILITFRTAFFDKFDRLRLIIDECSIAHRYISGWFFLDLLTSIPFEFIFSPKSTNIIFFVKILRVFRFIRIIKILRLFKMIKYFDGFMSQFVIRELLLCLKFIKIFALMVLFAHICACCWFFVGYQTMENETGSWLTSVISHDRSVVDAESTFTLYSYAWYWAVVTLFTTGYGDITATHGNKAEQWLVSICILCGTCFFAYFIGTLTSLITEGDRIKSVEIQKLEEAQAFCDQKKLPRELSRAVLTHIRYHCSYNYVFDDSELIASLPPYLQNDIHSFLAQTILQQFTFLSHLNAQILGQISLKMRSISCNENYCLFQRGDRAKDIYIQRTGESHIDFHDGSSIKIKRGHIVGENACISPKRKITVTCDTFSEFYVLAVQDIISILQTEYAATWTKRWKKIVKNLKNDIRKKGKKYVRFVDFNKHKKRQKKNKHKKKQDLTKKKNSKNHEKNTNTLKHWINAGSTIHKNKTQNIKSVQLNAFGGIDTPTMHKNEALVINPFQFAVDNKESEEEDEPLPKLIATSRSDPVLATMRSNADNSIRNNASTEEEEDNERAHIKKKSSRFGALFMKRSSLDRDYAIHRSAQKSSAMSRAKSEANILSNNKSNNPKMKNSFYDMSSTKDSSDDAADIVPVDYDDDDDDDDDINVVYSKQNKAHDDDILDAVENIEKLYKSRKQKRVKFSALNLDENENDKSDKNDHWQASSPQIHHHQMKRSVLTSSPGRKGGKFGAAKRRKIHKTSQQKRKIHHVQQRSSNMYKKHAQIVKQKERERNAMIPVRSSTQNENSVDVIYDQKENEGSDENNDGLILVAHYSDARNDADKNTNLVLQNSNSTKL